MEIKIDASDLLNQLDMLDERARKVDDLTVRDMKRRVPGAVSAATASVYRIKRVKWRHAQPTLTITQGEGEMPERPMFVPVSKARR